MNHVCRRVFGQGLFVAVAFLALVMSGCQKSPEDALADFRATAAKMGESGTTAPIPMILGRKYFAAADELMASNTPETQAAYRTYRAAVLRTGRDGTEQTTSNDIGGRIFYRIWNFAVYFIFTAIGVFALLLLRVGIGSLCGKKKGNQAELEAVHRQIEENRAKRR